MIDMTEKAKRMAEIVREIESVREARRKVSKEFGEELEALWNELEKLGGDVESEQMSLDDADGGDETTMSMKVNDGPWTEPITTKEFNRRVKRGLDKLKKGELP